MPVATWTPPALWSVPREWVGERCFILCGGPSLAAQRHLVPRLRGRIIAIKEGLILRPDADVWFLCGEQCWQNCGDLSGRFRGRYIVARGRSSPEFPDTAKRVGRHKVHTEVSDDPRKVSGFDAGSSAINLAYLFGAQEIVLLGFDLSGGRWFSGERRHTQPVPRSSDHARHLGPLPDFAADLARKGVRVFNASPITATRAFPVVSLEAFL